MLHERVATLPFNHPVMLSLHHGRDETTTPQASPTTMWTPTQDSVLSAFCQLAGIAESGPQLLTSGALVCDGMSLSVLPGLHDPDIALLLNFGPVPANDEARILRRLLELNLLLARGEERLGIDPESGDLIFHCLLRNPTASGLLTAIVTGRGLAQRWHAHRFLDDQSAELPA